MKREPVKFVIVVVTVKATGVLCLLGIGVGLGSLLFYRIYSHLFPNTALPAPPSATGQKRQLFNKSKCLVCGRSSESRSPLHKRRAVAAAGTSGGEAVTMRGVPQGDTLSPQVKVSVLSRIVCLSLCFSVCQSVCLSV